MALPMIPSADPISMGINAVGLGLQIYGAFSGSSDAHKAAGISKDIANQEMQINALKQQQMELEGRRTQVQNIRNTQRSIALGLNSAVNQGAQMGSGLGGGYAQSVNQGNWNMLGVDQALGIGRDIAGHNNKISQDKMQLADVQSDQATDQGIASLGGSLLKSGGIIGQFAQGFGGKSNPYYGPLDYNG